MKQSKDFHNFLSVILVSGGEKYWNKQELADKTKSTSIDHMNEIYGKLRDMNILDCEQVNNSLRIYFKDEYMDKILDYLLAWPVGELTDEYEQHADEMYNEINGRKCLRRIIQHGNYKRWYDSSFLVEATTIIGIKDLTCTIVQLFNKSIIEDHTTDKYLNFKFSNKTIYKIIDHIIS